MIAAIFLVVASAGASPTQATERFTPEQLLTIQNQMERLNRISKLTNEQALIVYDQCLSREAAALSRSELAAEAVFGQARQRCIALKADLLNSSPAERFSEFKKLDDAKAASFPTLTNQLRERRRAFEAQAGKSPSAPN